MSLLKHTYNLLISQMQQEMYIINSTDISVTIENMFFNNGHWIDLTEYRKQGLSNSKSHIMLTVKQKGEFTVTNWAGYHRNAKRHCSMAFKRKYTTVSGQRL